MTGKRLFQTIGLLIQKGAGQRGMYLREKIFWCLQEKMSISSRD
ncbi:hypothetical protein Lac2_04490 [Claveliimonas bilis]|nr:hypothetical protein [Claveliimonas bilis]BDZ82315.1 hypothetical protein Lac2_04490 [Claveliimonas bilis]